MACIGSPQGRCILNLPGIRCTRTVLCPILYSLWFHQLCPDNQRQLPVPPHFQQSVTIFRVRNRIAQRSSPSREARRKTAHQLVGIVLCPRRPNVSPLHSGPQHAHICSGSVFLYTAIITSMGNVSISRLLDSLRYRCVKTPCCGLLAPPSSSTVIRVRDMPERFMTQA